MGATEQNDQISVKINNPYEIKIFNMFIINKTDKPLKDITILDLKNLTSEKLKENDIWEFPHDDQLIPERNEYKVVDTDEYQVIIHCLNMIGYPLLDKETGDPIGKAEHYYSESLALLKQTKKMELLMMRICAQSEEQAECDIHLIKDQPEGYSNTIRFRIREEQFQKQLTDVLFQHTGVPSSFPLPQSEKDYPKPEAEPSESIEQNDILILNKLLPNEHIQFSIYHYHNPSIQGDIPNAFEAVGYKPFRKRL